MRAWLAKGDLHAAESAVIDSWCGPASRSPLEVEDVAVNDLFSAGDRVAFHVIQRGRYRGGIPGANDAWLGRALELRCVGLARVEDAEVRAVRAITDRLGARAALARALTA